MEESQIKRFSLLEDHSEVKMSRKSSFANLKGFHLDVKNLTISYKPKSKNAKGHTILNDININIENSKMVAIVGSSGAGKTSLLNFLSG